MARASAFICCQLRMHYDGSSERDLLDSFLGIHLAVTAIDIFAACSLLSDFQPHRTCFLLLSSSETVLCDDRPVHSKTQIRYAATETRRVVHEHLPRRPKHHPHRMRFLSFLSLCPTARTVAPHTLGPQDIPSWTSTVTHSTELRVRFSLATRRHGHSSHRAASVFGNAPPQQETHSLVDSFSLGHRPLKHKVPAQSNTPAAYHNLQCISWPRNNAAKPPKRGEVHAALEGVCWKSSRTLRRSVADIAK